MRVAPRTQNPRNRVLRTFSVLRRVRVALRAMQYFEREPFRFDATLLRAIYPDDFSTSQDRVWQHMGDAAWHLEEANRECEDNTAGLPRSHVLAIDIVIAINFIRHLMRTCERGESCAKEESTERAETVDG